MFKLDHEYFMQLALLQADRALEDGEVPTGCVIVHSPVDRENAAPTVIARAYNQVERLCDATAHAEMIALTQAASALGDWRLQDTILYVTKEPCAMCAGAIVLSRVPTVVFGCSDPRRGGAVSVFNILQHPQLNHRCEVISGVREAECAERLRGFFREKRAKIEPTD